MIITRTPYRISLFGGGSDYPQWYLQHGGAVLGLSIDKYCYISVRYLPPFFEHKHRVVYSKIERIMSIDEIEHPAVRAVLTEMKVTQGLEIHYDGDVPARSGLGSSSSFVVGLLQALYALQGQMVTKRDLAAEAIRIEQKVLCENVGSQDQIFAAYGGLNRIDFARDSSYAVTPIIMPNARATELVGHLVMFFTGVERYSSDIAGDMLANFSVREAQLMRMREIVEEAQTILTDPARNIGEIGSMLHESWRLKRELAQTVSNAMIDAIYEEGRVAGASGGKILGAGGGGFILFFVEPEKQKAVRERLKKLIEVKVKVDAAGSTVIVYNPER